MIVAEDAIERLDDITDQLHSAQDSVRQLIDAATRAATPVRVAAVPAAPAANEDVSPLDAFENLAVALWKNVRQFMRR